MRKPSPLSSSRVDTGATAPAGRGTFVPARRARRWAAIGIAALLTGSILTLPTGSAQAGTGRVAAAASWTGAGPAGAEPALRLIEARGGEAIGATGIVSGTAVPSRGWLHSYAGLRHWVAPVPVGAVSEAGGGSAAASATSSGAGDTAVRRQASGRLTEVSFVKTQRPVLALTFDCGAADGALPRILDILQNYGVVVTFFVTGDFAERYPEMIRRIVAEGHELANHTQTHRDLVDLSDNTIRRELRSTDEILSSYSGVTTKPLMRMPFGNRNTRVTRIVNEEGYRSIYWSLDSGDWRETATAPGVLNTVLKYGEAGDVVVHHCSPRATALALPGILDGLAAQGLYVVTVSNLLQDE